MINVSNIINVQIHINVFHYYHLWCKTKDSIHDVSVLNKGHFWNLLNGQESKRKWLQK